MSNLSQSQAHQIHQIQVVFLLCTGHQHTQNLFVEEHVRVLLSFEDMWPSSMLSTKRGRNENSSKLGLEKSVLCVQLTHHAYKLCKDKWHYHARSQKGSRFSIYCNSSYSSIVVIDCIQYAVHHDIRIAYKKRVKTVSWLGHPAHGCS